MTNLSRKTSQAGAATLVITTLLMVTATLIVMFAAGYTIMQQKITGNQIRNESAFFAAEAGLEFGINYFLQNASTITATPVGGFIRPYTSTATTNVTLGNNSTFSVTYTNPTSANYNVILVTAVGTSDDGTSTRTISQLIDYGSVLFAPTQNSMVVKGNLTMSGSSQITNTQYNQNMLLSGALTMSGSVQTTTSSGTTTTASHIGSDVQQNNATLQATSIATLFSDYFGAPEATIKGQMAHVYSNTNSTNYSSTLNNMTGTTIWIDQPSGTASLTGSTAIGSPSKPVLIIVNGNLAISGSTSIYGFLFVVGTTSATEDISGSFQLTGAMATGDSLSMSGSTNITYNSTMLVGVQTSANTTYYAKVPGAWKDF
jgi:Tfp pilus assembly protein PilX